MTDKEKEAIDTLFHLEHINGYVDLYKEHDVIIKSDVLLKWKNATKTVLNLIQTQQAEIEQLKIAGNGMDLLLKQKTAEIEKKDKWINKLETKLMYALTPTKHELAKRTQEEFKEIIRDNIDEDTYTIKRKLKENWINL